MKPAQFHYLRPTDLTEALELLSEYGDDAKIISGGQSLIPILNMRLATPKYVIDLGRIAELRYIREDGDMIGVGALTRHVEAETSLLIRERCPILQEALRYVGHMQIRNRGTIGGSIAHADPSAELPCVLTALRGEIVIADAENEFTISPEEFFLTYMLTSLEPRQIVKEVRFPAISPASGWAFVEVSRRHGDFALVEVAAVIDLDEDGLVGQARIAVGGAGPVPTVLAELEEALAGQSPTDDLLKEAVDAGISVLEPDGDIHGSSEYRKHLAGVMTYRAVKRAVIHAQGGMKLE